MCISQETDIFAVLIRENITLGKNIPEKRLTELLEQADLLDWVQNLKNGLETTVGEKGVKLSSGQKQRINFIRGILLDRDIYLLDEPTSHLDTKTRDSIITMIEQDLSQKTLIIITHDDELRKLCTKNFTMQNHVLKSAT